MCMYVYVYIYSYYILVHADYHEHLVQTTVTELGDCLAASPSLVLIFHIYSY